MRTPSQTLTTWVRVAPPLVVALLLLGVWGARAAVGVRSKPKVLKLATGSAGGTAIEAGDELKRIVERALPGTEVEIVHTGGGDENLAKLVAKEVDLAIVHDTGGGWVDDEQPVRVIGPLYDEALHVVVATSANVKSLFDLSGRQVGVGPTGSGTARMVAQLLAASRLALDKTQLHELPHAEAAKALEAGTLDAFFVLAGVRSSAVDAALASGKARLLSLGEPGAAGSDAEGFRVVLPALDATIIPARAYGTLPEAPIATLGVTALWVTRDSLPESAAWSLAKSLTEHRRAAAETFPLLARTTPVPKEATLRYPLHAGAARYFHRDDPPFILAWADTLSLLLTLVLIGWSGLTAAVRWRLRQRKYRVDRYYGELQEMSKKLEGAKGLEELRRLRHELYALRRRAVDDLMAGKLEPDESFTIFQDYVRSEIQEIDQLSRDAARAAAGP